MQKLAELCVRRPVLRHDADRGHDGGRRHLFFQLGVDRYPRIEMPVVSVSTTNRGATPESVETEITDRVEAAVNTVAGIDELRSTSSEGRSRVNITFDLSKNPDVAAQEVRAKVDPVIRDLPDHGRAAGRAEAGPRLARRSCCSRSRRGCRWSS
jgi:hydrophobic/amphiphilic exporter-1 (mainly G- bacteria), HAE1 family